MRYVVVSGGVISGIGAVERCHGHGAETAQARAPSLLPPACSSKRSACASPPSKSTPVRRWLSLQLGLSHADLNCDAGLMSPTEHGEVYVLDDGGEADLDLGNYERYLDVTLSRENNLTTGYVRAAS